jgi:hypothetical protein
MELRARSKVSCLCLIVMANDFLRRVEFTMRKVRATESRNCAEGTRFGPRAGRSRLKWSVLPDKGNWNAGSPLAALGFNLVPFPSFCSAGGLVSGTEPSDPYNSGTSWPTERPITSWQGLSSVELNIILPSVRSATKSSLPFGLSD